MFESQFSQKTDFKVKKTWRDYEEDSRKAQTFKILNIKILEQVKTMIMNMNFK